MVGGNMAFCAICWMQLLSSAPANWWELAPLVQYLCTFNGVKMSHGQRISTKLGKLPILFYQMVVKFQVAQNGSPFNRDLIQGIWIPQTLLFSLPHSRWIILGIRDGGPYHYNVGPPRQLSWSITPITRTYGRCIHSSWGYKLTYLSYGRYIHS